MTDYHISHPSRETLEALMQSEGIANYLAIAQGRSATEESTDEFGNVIPAQPAIGDPARWYTCIRTEQTEIVLPEGTAVVDPAIVTALCGVWA